MFIGQVPQNEQYELEIPKDAIGNLKKVKGVISALAYLDHGHMDLQAQGRRERQGRRLAQAVSTIDPGTDAERTTKNIMSPDEFKK